MRADCRLRVVVQNSIAFVSQTTVQHGVASCDVVRLHQAFSQVRRRKRHCATTFHGGEHQEDGVACCTPGRECCFRSRTDPVGRIRKDLAIEKGATSEFDSQSSTCCKRNDAAKLRRIAAACRSLNGRFDMILDGRVANIMQSINQVGLFYHVSSLVTKAFGKGRNKSSTSRTTNNDAAPSFSNSCFATLRSPTSGGACMSASWKYQRIS